MGTEIEIILLSFDLWPPARGCICSQYFQAVCITIWFQHATYCRLYTILCHWCMGIKKPLLCC